VRTLDPATQVYTTTVFQNGTWNNGTPKLNVAEAAFFNLGPVVLVPEPSSLALLAIGSVFFFATKRDA
jgi:hypothetical protein